MVLGLGIAETAMWVRNCEKILLKDNRWVGIAFLIKAENKTVKRSQIGVKPRRQESLHKAMDDNTKNHHVFVFSVTKYIMPN